MTEQKPKHPGGRPRIDNPRSDQYQVRLDKDESAALLGLRVKLGTAAHPRPGSDAFRWLLDKYRRGLVAEDPPPPPPKKGPRR